MKLPEFVFVTSKDLPGGELLLQTTPPYSAFRAFKFDNERDMETFIRNTNIFGVCGTVTGYNILVCHVGTIDGIQAKVTPGHLLSSGDKNSTNQATFFYEQNRIKGNESRLKKYATGPTAHTGR